MKKVYRKILYICSLIVIVSGFNVQALLNVNNDEAKYNINARRDILVLMLSYSEYIEDIEKDKDGFIYFIMKSGNKIIYDDMLSKSHDEKVANPDLQDMLEESYPLEHITSVVEENKNPGRRRVYSFLNEIYGNGEGEIKSKLSISKSKFGNLQFNKENNATDSLNNALNKSYEECEKKSKIWVDISPINGTFNYRVIQGTGRLSAHAYGIAIDLNRNPYDFWKWATIEQGNERMKNYPQELVKAFEDNGFIWGGKWSCFDILHYEYRPELILKAKYFSDIEINEDLNWYEGVELNDRTKAVIDLINKKLD